MHSCQKEKEVVRDSDQTGQMGYRVDTLSVSVDEETSYLYNRFTTFYDRDDFYLVAYNRIKHKIQFFDLDKKRETRSIVLERGGEHAVSDIQNLIVHSLDSIFVFDSGNMSILNRKGEVFYKVNLFELAYKDMRPDFSDFTSKPFFNKMRKSVILGNSHGLGANADLDNSFLLEFDLQTKSYSELNFSHAEFYKNAEGDFGPFSQVNFSSVSDETIVFNYKVESSIYRQNIGENEPQRFNGSISSIPSLANRFTASSEFHDVMRYRHETARYYGVLYDPYRELYYRVHRTGKPYKESERNVLRNTTFYLSVFDRNLKLLKEINLGSNIYTQFSWFVAPQGFCINAAFADYELLDESKMIIHAFDFFFE